MTVQIPTVPNNDFPNLGQNKNWATYMFKLYAAQKCMEKGFGDDMFVI